MQLSKCSRCGCFFMANSDVCPNCQPKDMSEMNKLKSFLLESNNSNASLEEISYETGISLKNLHRHFYSDEFANHSFEQNHDLNTPNIQL